ncbi:cathepsin B-like cysteine proteinase 4 [Lycorma delicatula]|uniref:cathepsin B-like cysteine proteinase 4 n=1 Tax=Lycorma delicatula TaxID=130591 RepID=UPI003F519B3D
MLRLILGLICIVNVCAITSNDLHNKEVEQINNAQKYWIAAPNDITKRGLQYMKKLLGAKLSTDRLPLKEVNVTNAIPSSFDARSAWKYCPSISSIKNQSLCGSCWAIATTSCISDRICIATKGKIKISISAENLLTCCSQCTDPHTAGCDGGYTDKAYLYYQETGLVTGGDYNSKEGCQPYAIGPANPLRLYTPPCSKKCTNKDYKISYSKDKHYGSKSYSLMKDVAKIQGDIMEYGPVTATFDVYSDFGYYKTGVYIKTSNKKIEKHSVKIFGWGDENDVSYWLAANTWGKDWGDNGFFKIRRGTNECGIESQITAGLPKISTA